MEKKYRVVITEVETGETHLDETYSGLCLLGDRDGESMAEVILNTNLVNIAAMMASCTKVSIAARLATFGMDQKAKKTGEAERNLFAAIMEGVMNDE